jgi:hypothetical protein
MASNTPDSFQCGPFEVTRSPDVRQFVEKLNRLREAVDAYRIQPGVGYTLNRSPGGTVLSIRQDGGSAAATYEHPFKLSVRKKDNQYQFFALQGTVGNNQKKVDNIEKWVDFNPNQPSARIFLEATITDLAIDKLTLKTQASDAELARTEIKAGKQSVARISIGLYVPTQADKKDYRIIQNVTTNIMTPLFCYSGYPALSLTQEFLNAYYS